MSDKYRFETEPHGDSEVRLTWSKNDDPQQPLDFWIVPKAFVEHAKRRVEAGEMD